MPKDQPLVSIITPVYNAEVFLKETIASVQAQSYKNWEWILVDDTSKDESAEIIKEYMKADSRIKLLQLKKNSGAAIARNTGSEQAKGQYLAFLDADDLWHATKLETQVEFMKKNNHKFSFTGYEFADEYGKGNGTKVHVPAKITYSQALKNHIISTITVMIDLDQIPKEAVMMPNVRRGQDAATWWQILRTQGPAYGINKSLSLYRRTNNSLSANKLKAIKRTWYLLRKVEKLNLLYSIYCFCWYAFNATKKRL